MQENQFHLKKSMPIVAEKLRTAAVKRNAKTALFLGIASSGAIISAPALAVTAVGSFASLYAWGYIQKRKA